MESVPVQFYSNPTYHALRGNVVKKLHALFYPLVDITRCHNIILEIECSCYNHTIDLAEQYNVDTQWSNKKFIDIYCSVTYKVFANIDPESTVGNDAILNRVINNSLPPGQLATMSSDDFMPEKSASTRSEIQKRLTSHAEGKTSTMYRCNNCGHKEAYVKEVQLRSLDEGANISAICKFCNNKWIAA